MTLLLRLSRTLAIVAISLVHQHTLAAQILNAVLLLWWLGLPLALILVANAQQAQIRAAQQAAAEEAERRRNPFANIFRGRGGAGSGASRGGGFSSRPSSSPRGGQYSGPIIEAEWRPLDDDKK